MTQNEIIEMADKADDLADAQLQMKGEFHPDWHTVRDEIFAKLVAAKERDHCCEKFEIYWNSAGLQSCYSPTEYIKAEENT